MVCSSCSTSDTRRVNLVANPVISHKRGKDRKVLCKMDTCCFFFIIDGPDNVTLSISGNQVSVTQGRQLGPITCSAVCYMECGYIWKRLKNGVYSIVMVGQNFTIYSTSMDDGGSYICYVTHKNDTSRIGTVTMEISVQSKLNICKTFYKTSYFIF